MTEELTGDEVRRRPLIDEWAGLSTHSADVRARSPVIISWGRMLGESTALKTWRGARDKSSFVIFVHSDPYRDLMTGDTVAVESFRYTASLFWRPPRALPRSPSPRGRALALKWRRSR